MTDEVVTRLYRCLAEELRTRGHPDGHPVKVSDLYQELVPYGAVRSALEVELNADYEHALLRLLAGERGLLRLEPEQAREELRREVDAPYPFVGLFRKFSASDVWVTMPAAPAASTARPDRVSTPAPTAGPQPHAPRGARPAAAGNGDAAERDGPAPPRIAARQGGALPARAPVQLHAESPPGASSGELSLHPAADCAFCGGGLPVGRRIRYCPFCGGDQRLRPCPRCEAVLERDWRYCISCGHETPAG